VNATASAIFYGPGDWMGSKFDVRQRRAIAAWTLILIIVTMPLRYPYRSYVSLVWAISEVALIFAMWGVTAAETPVEEQNK
jgi:hypothetical protein